MTDAKHWYAVPTQTTDLIYVCLCEETVVSGHFCIFVITREPGDEKLAYLLLTLSDAHCCHMGAAIKHPVPDRVKPSFVIFDIRTL